MLTVAKSRAYFIGFGILSIGCFLSALAYPLQKYEVYQQSVVGAFGIEHDDYFILSENSKQKPYGFDSDKAVLVEQNLDDHKFEKIMLLIASLTASGLCVYLGNGVVEAVEIDSEVAEIKAQSKRQLLIEGVKHRFAMASKSQRLLFMDEMKALIEEFGSVEGEVLTADETNETDKFTQVSYLLADGLSLPVAISQCYGLKPDTSEHAEIVKRFKQWNDDDESGVIEIDRKTFPLELDDTCRKAVLKAVEDGVNDTDILTDVLGVTKANLDAGRVYLDFLRGK
jgi:hypothetical protein